MGQWNIESRAWQQVLTHNCEHLRGGDSSQILRQDIGGGYIRCERCGETYLPDASPGNSRLLLRVQAAEAPDASPPAPAPAQTPTPAHR